MDDEPSAELDAAADKFYSAAGRCIAGWSFIDRTLFDIFEVALGTESIKASIIYYRSPSFSDHLVLTDKIVSAVLEKKTPPRIAWDRLKKKMDQLSPVRNKIAHHPTTIFRSSGGRRRDDGTWHGTNDEWISYVEEPRKHLHLLPEERFGQAMRNQLRYPDLARHHSETVDLHQDLQTFLEEHAGALRMPAPGPT